MAVLAKMGADGKPTPFSSKKPSLARHQSAITAQSSTDPYPSTVSLHYTLQFLIPTDIHSHETHANQETARRNDVGDPR
jgi:hypothetical protein